MKQNKPAQLSAKEIFILAVGVKSVVEREVILLEHCSANPDLLKQVQRLLVAAENENRGSPLDAIVDAFRPNASSDNPDSNGIAQLAVNDDQTTALTSIKVGGQIGRYRLMEQIGEGGMGVVYVAVQQHPICRKVALKLIKPGMDSKQVIARFEAERQTLAMMNHSNIAKVLDAGTTKTGLPYFVMELVKGIPITEYCDAHKLDLQQRLELFIKVCEAVQHAHQKGIIHRDLKPSNVLVELEDVRSVPKVIDFGVAKATQQPLVENAVYTGLSQMIGTPLYMSPEQAEYNSLDIDTRSDVYSLGVILYELITGSTPFDREIFKRVGFDEMRRIIREDEPARPSSRVSTLQDKLMTTLCERRKTNFKQLAKTLKGELDWIILKSLEKDRLRRYQSASDFSEDIRRFLNDEPVKACPPNWRYRMGKLARRHKGLLSAGVMLLAAASIFSLLLWNERSTTLAALAGERDQRFVAVEQRQLAKDQEQLALQREAAAVESRRLALNNQYNAEIVSGHVDLQRGYLRRLESKLRGHLPLEDQQDRRGWEWYYLWAAGHPEMRTLSASSLQTFATWSPNGRYIGSSGDIWDAATGQVLRRFDPTINLRYRSAWSPDSQYFAWGTSSDDNCVYLWNRETDELNELRGHTESVWCLAWSPDGKLLISGGIDKTLRIWDVATREVVRSLQTSDFVTDVSFSPGGELITACAKSSGVLVWQTDTGELCKNLSSELRDENPMDSEKVQHSWRPDGQQLAISTTNAWLLFRRDDWSLIRKQPLPSQHGRDIAWSRDGSKLALADGQVISIWDPSAAEPVRVLTGHTAPVINIDWSTTNEQLVTSDNLGSVKIWDLKSNNNPALLSTDAGLQSLAWTDDSNRLLFEHTDGGTSTWNLQKGVPIARSPSPGTVEPSVWSPDRGRVARYSDTDAAVVRIHNGKDNAVQSVCRLESEGRISQIAWSNDGSSLAIAQQVEKRVMVTMWDIDSEQSISKWNYVGPVASDKKVIIYPLKMVWSPDHQYLAVGSWGEEGDNGTQIWQGHIYVVNVQSGNRVLKYNVGGGRHRADIKAIAWRPDGQAVVAGTELGLIEAILLNSGTTIFSHPLNNTSIRSLSWNLDGDRIAAAADDGSVKILDANSGTDLLTFSHVGKPHHVAWSPNGRCLAAATQLGQVQVWDATRAYAWEKNNDRRSELAKCYAVAIDSETASDREVRLKRALKLAPDTLDSWMLRGKILATLEDFAGAAAEYSKVVNLNRNRSVVADYNYCIALLGSGQYETLREHCTVLLGDLKGSAQSPSIKRNFIRLTMLIPQVDIDPEISIQIGRDFVENYGASNASAKLVLGTCLYRGGKFQEAADILAEAKEQLERQGNPAERSDLANALCVLAMTRYQLGHPFQANRIFEQSLAISQRLPSDLSWSILVPLQVLQREARGLIQDGPIVGEKQKIEDIK
jgi:serine/threonine protein kinase/WD40 repeat protein